MKHRVHNQLGQDHQQKYFFRGTVRLKSKMGSQHIQIPPRYEWNTPRYKTGYLPM